MMNSADPTPLRRIARPAEAISTYLQWKYGVQIDAGDVEKVTDELHTAPIIRIGISTEIAVRDMVIKVSFE